MKLYGKNLNATGVIIGFCIIVVIYIYIFWWVSLF